MRGIRIKICRRYRQAAGRDGGDDESGGCRPAVRKSRVWHGRQPRRAAAICEWIDADTFARLAWSGALAAIQAATQFDWTWTVDDLPTFSERIGWQSRSPDYKYPSLTTNLDVNRTEASVSVDSTARPDVRCPLQQMWFFASDVVLDDPICRPEWVDSPMVWSPRSLPSAA
ncbi:DUF6301 family protein [Nocardia mikamii]|uniref:DUF6301 family protein n=1 Tax=Nocardia mikamii TaxID=508464 RepID=UPI00350E3EB9